MDFFIKKIFDEKTDELVHLQFQKFSKGIFRDRAMIRVTNYNGKFKINTTNEYANEFVRFMAEKLGDNKTNVTGVIVSTRALDEEIEFVDKKQFMGVKQYVIEKEMEGKEILTICDKFPNSFMGLSFNADGSELKIKAKAPKSGKPASKGKEEPKVDFCKLNTLDRDIVNSLVFDYGEDFKKIEINHDFIIDELVISDDLKKEFGNDFSKLREFAKRKGKIIRKIKIDDREIIKETKFEA